MRANANLLGMPVLVVCLCALPAGSAAVRSSPNPHLRDTRSAYLQRASRQPVEWYPWGAEAWISFRQALRQSLRIYRERRTQIERDGFDVIHGE